MSPEIQSMVIGGAVTLAFGLVAYFVRGWFTNSDDDRKELKRETAALAQGHTKITTEMTHLCQKVDRSTELIDKLSDQVAENVRANGRIEGRLDEHMSMMSNYMATMAHMSKQLDAVFRYIDADKRKTDV